MSGNTTEKMSVTVLKSTICIFLKKHQKIPKHYFFILATMCFKPQLIKKNLDKKLFHNDPYILFG